ncbi:MAG: dienelactone hydrolase family protein [Alphaproteobacteria bacterium]|nr:dienelactone hydrolase family protein [Alphaproteobacteria bacterium]
MCLPASRRGPAVLVIHSWWGLTPAFHAFGEALAREGFIVGLADLFEGKTASDPAEAKRLRRAPRRTPLYKTLIGNIGELQSADGVAGADIGVVGFSMGGHWAVWLSQRPELPIGATVLYYAARAGDFTASQSSYLAHYAEEDPWVSRTARRRMEAAIAKAGRPYQGFDYPGTGHWFAEQGRDQDFAPDAAALAFGRTVMHLKEKLCRK